MSNHHHGHEAHQHQHPHHDGEPEQLVLCRGRLVSRATVLDEAYLLHSTTSSYSMQWNNQHDHGADAVSFWMPTPADNSYSVVGGLVYPDNNLGQPPGSSLIIKEINPDPNNPILRSPLGWNRIWHDLGSGAPINGSIWFPVPPDGYVSIGYVVWHGYVAPDNVNYACVRSDYVDPAFAGTEVWNDSGSGAEDDVSCWALQLVSNAFVAQRGYTPWSGTAYKIKGM